MRYTAVFEFKEGEEPAINKIHGWLGGELCAVQFSDALNELMDIKAAAEAVISENAHSGDDSWWHLAKLLGWEVGDDDTADKRPNANVTGLAPEGDKS